MNKNFYLKLYKPFEEDIQKKKKINMLNEIITKTVYYSFPIFLVFEMFFDFVLSIRLFFTTFISFVLLSYFRKKFNFKRPYEVFNVKPVLNKKAKGKSFPSRHVFSAFVIGTSCLYVNTYYALFVLILGILLMFIRVLGGVHFIRDVICGAIIGIILGVLGMTFSFSWFI